MHFVLTSDQINQLTTAAVQWGHTKRREADDFGRTLWETNLRAVERVRPENVLGYQARYVERYRYLAHDFVDPDWVADLVVTVTGCCCGLPDWDVCPANAALTRLLATANTVRELRLVGTAESFDWSG